MEKIWIQRSGDYRQILNAILMNIILIRWISTYIHVILVFFEFFFLPDKFAGQPLSEVTYELQNFRFPYREIECIPRYTILYKIQ